MVIIIIIVIHYDVYLYQADVNTGAMALCFFFFLRIQNTFLLCVQLKYTFLQTRFIVWLWNLRFRIVGESVIYCIERKILSKYEPKEIISMKFFSILKKWFLNWKILALIPKIFLSTFIIFFLQFFIKLRNEILWLIVCETKNS